MDAFALQDPQAAAREIERGVGQCLRDDQRYALDYPYQFVADEVREQDNLPITLADKRLSFQTNAERVFNL